METYCIRIEGDDLVFDARLDGKGSFRIYEIEGEPLAGAAIQDAGSHPAGDAIVGAALSGDPLDWADLLRADHPSTLLETHLIGVGSDSRNETSRDEILEWLVVIFDLDQTEGTDKLLDEIILAPACNLKDERSALRSRFGTGSPFADRDQPSSLARDVLGGWITYREPNTGGWQAALRALRVYVPSGDPLAGGVALRPVSVLLSDLRRQPRTLFLWHDYVYRYDEAGRCHREPDSKSYDDAIKVCASFSIGEAGSVRKTAADSGVLNLAAMIRCYRDVAAGMTATIGLHEEEFVGVVEEDATADGESDLPLKLLGARGTEIDDLLLASRDIADAIESPVRDADPKTAALVVAIAEKSIPRVEALGTRWRDAMTLATMTFSNRQAKAANVQAAAASRQAAAAEESRRLLDRAALIGAILVAPGLIAAYFGVNTPDKIGAHPGAWLIPIMLLGAVGSVGLFIALRRFAGSEGHVIAGGGTTAIASLTAAALGAFWLDSWWFASAGLTLALVSLVLLIHVQGDARDRTAT